MSVREEIEINLVMGAGVSADGAKAMLDAYTHELAEQQRAALKANPGIFEPALINLIDPERQPGERWCGWEEAHESHRWVQGDVWYLCRTVVLNSGN